MTDDRARVAARPGPGAARGRFDGQVAVVTGAGAGLGRAYALELARRGASVVVNDVLADAADRVVSEIGQLGGDSVASHASVMTATGGQEITDVAHERFGRIDALINNAGFLRNGMFEDLTVTDLDEIIDVHLKAAFYVTQPVWRIMKRQGHGRIVLTGSGAAVFSRPGLANYAAAKMGVLGLARALAYEGAEFNINVNSVLPIAKTTITDRNPIPDREGERARHRLGDPGVVAERSGVELVVPMTIYLASGDCGFTGEVFSACFGRFARVFSGVADGWLADSPEDVNLESVVENIELIRDVGSYSIPVDLFDEAGSVMERLGARPLERA